MNKKSSAHYQREFRRRLREQGLVKKEVWIRPENAKRLALVEKQLRNPDISTWINVGDVMTNNTNESAGLWTTQTLMKALEAEALIESGRATVELIEGVEPSLYVVMKEFGDLPVFLTVVGEQIIVEAVLWPQSVVTDVTAFNDAILRTHKYFPLSTISLDSMQEDEDYYHMFGALSSTSLISNVVFEIEVLATNVIQATEAYSEFLRVESN
ncbi:YjfI family protein [Alkalimarinus sediminis]|uniref:YjfI family protein n=1 Tax=Alkalimarinus sediminis TaxID=1632866 RepID=A0A9E8HIT3_9ALTE|nr:YjfI family protein [Alkalimarinus sediminis]UZW74972.1 YjfI family protein [Alkalimarinus sediminis]